MKARTGISRFLAAGLAVAVAVLIFGLAAGLAAETPKRGGVITLGLNTDLTSLDPNAGGAINTIVLNHILEPLAAYGEKLEILPVLAERWEMSPDYKTYTFFLRQGRLFHNGREMVAEDVKYSIEHIMDPQTKNRRRSLFGSIDSLEVVDKYTVKVHLNKPDPNLLTVLAYTSPVMAIVPKEEVEKQGGVFTHPIGTGPYKFVEWKPDRHVLLERFEQYKPLPEPMNGLAGARVAYADKIKFVPIPEESVSIMALLNKEVDALLYYPIKYVDKYNEDYSKRGVVVQEITGLSWAEIWFGCDKPLTSNVKFRQACAYAIDLEVVAKAAFQGHAQVNPSVVPKQNHYWTPAHETWYKKDLAKAKQLLKEAGYKGETIPLQTNKKYNYMYQQAVAVQAELKAAGINTELEVVEWPVTLKNFYKGEYQILSFGASAIPDPVSGYSYLRLNHFFEQVPRLKEVLDQAAQAADEKKRTKLFEEAHQLCYENVPLIMLYNYNYLQAQRDYVKGYKVSNLGFPRLWGVWLDK